MLAHSLNKDEPAIFERKHIYNSKLITLLSNYNKLDKFPVNDREAVLDYFLRHWRTDQCLTIQLPYNERKDIRSFRYLGINAMQLFINDVKEDFYYKLQKHIKKRSCSNVQRKDSIMEFLKFYDITEDDVLFESIYRQTTRILEYEI